MKISEWIESSTVHGIRHIFNGSGTKFSRTFWVIVMLASVSGLLFNYHLLYEKLNLTPDIHVRIGQKFTKDIPFPAVTVCNPLFAKNSLVRFYNIFKQFRLDPEGEFNLTDQERNYFAANIQACSPEIGIRMKDCVRKRTENEAVKFLNESSLLLSESVVNCYYKGYFLDCSKIFNRVLTDRGFCYTFNMQSFKTIFNDKVISKDFHTFKRSNISRSLLVNNKLHNEKLNDDKNATFEWSLDHGYAEGHETDSVPVRADKGKVVAFNPFLKEIDVGNVCITFGNVFSLYLHLPNEIMLPSHLEYYVEFRKRKDIIITAKSYTADESMRKFIPKSRGCYFEGEKKLKFFKTYTKALCEFECLTNYTLKMCNCVKFSMPRTSTTPVCSLDRIDCYFKAMNSWPDVSIAKNKFEATCGCLKTCNDIKYDFKFEKTSSTDNTMPILEILNFTKGDAVSRIGFMFDDFEILEYEEYATYQLQNFVADLGGLLGFFLGCSVLSLIEVGYFSLGIISSKLKALWHRLKRTNDSNNQNRVIEKQKHLSFIKTLKKVSDETYISPARLYK